MNKDEITNDTDKTNRSYETAKLLLGQLVDILRDNPFAQSNDSAEILWDDYVPAEYAAHHADEYGEQSLKLMEAQALAAFIRGNVADGLFLALVLSGTDFYAMSDDYKHPRVP